MELRIKLDQISTFEEKTRRRTSHRNQDLLYDIMESNYKASAKYGSAFNLFFRLRELKIDKMY